MSSTRRTGSEFVCFVCFVVNVGGSAFSASRLPCSKGVTGCQYSALLSLLSPVSSVELSSRRLVANGQITVSRRSPSL